MRGPVDAEIDVAVFDLLRRREWRLERHKDDRWPLARHTHVLAIIVVIRDASEPIVIVRTRSGLEGYVVFASATRAAGLEESLAHSGATPLDDETAETIRIEAGIPRGAKMPCQLTTSNPG